MFFDEEITQQKKYSPTPTIKIKRWYEKVCSACMYASKDFGDYDNVGWWECDKGKRLANFKAFPKCNAKSCDEFKAIDLGLDDGWCYMMDFEKAFPKEWSKKLWNYIQFNKRMGNYKVGRVR